MSNQNITRAVELAGKIANAEKTGQPNLAALYEANMVQAMADAHKEIAAERAIAALEVLIKLSVEQFRAVFDAVAKFLAGTDPSRPEVLNGPKSEYTLAGPGKGNVA